MASVGTMGRRALTPVPDDLPLLGIDRGFYSLVVKPESVP